MSTAVTVYEPRIEDDERRFALQQREGTALAKSTWTPKHLLSENWEETVATCVGIVRMAEKWNMSPSMVAGETYSVHGKIGFQGKLYAALANAHGGLDGGLRVIYSGAGDKLAAVLFGCTGDLTNEDAINLKRFVTTDDSEAATDLELAGIKAIRVTFEGCKTSNDMWKKDPKQKLFYSGSTKWCRRFMPDLILGAISVEDIERIEYERTQGQPEPPRGIEGVKARLKIGQQAEEPKTEEPQPEHAKEPEFSLGKQPGDLAASKRIIGGATTKAEAMKAYEAEVAGFAWSEQEDMELEAFTNEHRGQLKK